jgi:hypothetical protein
MNFDTERDTVKELKALFSYLKQDIEKERKEALKARRNLKRCLAAQQFLQATAQAIQQKAHEKLAGVVSQCLQVVFDDPYTFEIDFQRKRGRTEADFKFSREGLKADPLSASGGGVVDVAAFSLRAACLILHRPRLRRLIVLDEPFKFVSADYRPHIRTMLIALAKDLGLQIILVTHIDEIQIDETGTTIQL